MPRKLLCKELRRLVAYTAVAAAAASMAKHYEVKSGLHD